MTTTLYYLQVPQNVFSSDDGNNLDVIGEIANASLPKADSSSIGIIPLDIEVKMEKSSLANNEGTPDSVDEVNHTSSRLIIKTASCTHQVSCSWRTHLIKVKTVMTGELLVPMRVCWLYWRQIPWVNKVEMRILGLLMKNQF